MKAAPFSFLTFYSIKIILVHGKHFKYAESLYIVRKNVPEYHDKKDLQRLY